MLSNKPGIRNLVEICAKKGIEHIVISPGSRNAPLIISFNEHGAFQCLSIPDERVAGFFALGIAQQIRKPAIISCTSGTAALNFAPAIAEAFYQKIPLLILTADRPIEWIHQGEGQAIQQREIFSNYVKRSYELPQEAKSKDDLWSNDRIICEAIDQTTTGSAGPVHLNIPFREPLYDIADYRGITAPKIIKTTRIEQNLPKYMIKELADEWRNSSKKMIVGGLLPIESTKNNWKLNSLLKKLDIDPSAIILTETTSNLFGKNFITNFDGILTTVKTEELAAFQPDLLLTIGGSFISKKIKHFLRNHPPNRHWHIEETDYFVDTFQALTRSIQQVPIRFFQQFFTFLEKEKNLKNKVELNRYKKRWLQRKKYVKALQKKYLINCQWSDLQAFNILLPALPKGTNLHLGNSTPVRYTQLFKTRKDITYNANRGVAGIDGMTSTAAGAAYITQKPTTIITGDMAFFYDSNAFWNSHLAPDFRVILINNEGGNIFRIIQGPENTAQLDTYFEAHHQRSAKYIAKTFNLTYFYAANASQLRSSLKKFYKKQTNNRPAILEIKTPRVENAAIWKGYYQYLKSN